MIAKILCWLGIHESHDEQHLKFTAAWMVHRICPRCGRHYTDCAPLELEESKSNG